MGRLWHCFTNIACQILMEPMMAIPWALGVATPGRHCACVTQNMRSTTAPWWVCSGFKGVHTSMVPMTTKPDSGGFFYGNSTGNHGFYQLFRGFSWRFSLKPILGMMVTEVSQWSNVPSCRWYFSLFMVLVPWNNVITTFLLVIPPLPWWLRLWTVRDLATSQNHGTLP